ncbi:hypothetical protein KKC83_04775 [Patescibacteria group bacterium]|nr:hypothetical protein [Candidatus Falkowbacteria bacterium]MBU3905414.1 hypothetical protein [Patescibacteria group bacterium]MCG2697659.1 hypothetical protein [Candidatus Parcubacteria bacterium]MBU4015046.1 hypothetical protein [Patescibacteria group bacterium]MBU4026831.1 hypothetical protein [Patescibacteria group bacterium]
MNVLKVGETVELPHGGRLTPIKGLWSTDNIIKLRDTECKVDKPCREYASDELLDGFMCGFCKIAGKAVKEQMAHCNIQRVMPNVKTFRNRRGSRIPMGYKTIQQKN